MKALKIVHSITKKVGRAAELRYNHHHDDKGRFCSAPNNLYKRYSNGGAKTIDKSKKKDYTEHEKDMMYAAQAKVYSKDIYGTKAYDGSTAKKVSNHAARRMDERDVSISEVKDTVANATISYPSIQHENAKVIRKDNTQAVYSDNGTVITVVNLRSIMEDE